ncbi:Cytoplasmic thioredoxin isoenzyme 2 [Arthrobotrys musiformis]|uniref:Thioredoxin n=1 Tax=Arthrobotrys musiformis TaxID=47236 RepID=A0AAV9WNF0_9PEZI
MVAEVKSQKEFTEIIGKDKVTVVDFHATWCGPCKQIAPFVEKLAGEFKDAAFIKVDVDEVSDVAAEFGVRAMPTFMIFRSGEKVSEVVGANPAALKGAVQSAVKA